MEQQPNRSRTILPIQARTQVAHRKTPEFKGAARLGILPKGFRVMPALTSVRLRVPIGVPTPAAVQLLVPGGPFSGVPVQAPTPGLMGRRTAGASIQTPTQALRVRRTGQAPSRIRMGVLKVEGMVEAHNSTPTDVPMGRTEEAPIMGWGAMEASFPTPMEVPMGLRMVGPSMDLLMIVPMVSRAVEAPVTV